MVDLESLLIGPAESQLVEYKQWLDLDSRDHQALLAKGLIALANFGGGKIVLGFKSTDHGALTLCDDEAPGDHRVAYAVERFQQVIERYASCRFEVTCEYVRRPDSDVVHPVISIPANVREVVFPKRTSPDGTTLVAGRLYTRLPGPKSATPETAGEWSTLIEGLVKRQGGAVLEFLDAIRRTEPSEIVAPTSGTADTAPPQTPQRTVRDRMSDIAPPPANANPLRAPEDVLEFDEVYVLENPVSEAKVVALTESIRGHLDRSMPTFRLFDIVGTRSRHNEYDSALRFGLSMVSFKGPFVEGAAWGEVRDNEFALSIERFLLKQFAELLAARSAPSRSLPRDGAALADFVKASAESIRDRGGHPDLVVFVEPEGDDVDAIFMHDQAWWNGALAIRGVPLQQVTFVHGQLAGFPVLQIHEAPVEHALVCVVDLAEYELLLMNVSDEKHDFLDFTVAPLSPEEAERWVRKSPQIRESMYQGRHHEPGSYSFEEAALRMQLMARYQLFAAGEVRERHRPRTVVAFLENAAEPENARRN